MPPVDRHEEPALVPGPFLQNVATIRGRFTLDEQESTLSLAPIFLRRHEGSVGMKESKGISLHVLGPGLAW